MAPSNAYLVYFSCSINSQRLEEDSKQEKTKDGDVSAVLPVTQAFLFSIIECGELLCNVTMKSRLSKGRPERSVSHGAFASSVVQGAGMTSWDQRFSFFISFFLYSLAKKIPCFLLVWLAKILERTCWKWLKIVGVMVLAALIFFSYRISLVFNRR